MLTTLDVVNDCLAIMGEAPLNAIAEDHSLKAAALNVLTRTDNKIQSEGWWYNTEDLLLTRSPVDFRVYLPSDALTIRNVESGLVRGSNGAVVSDGVITNRARYVQRGRVLYDLQAGTDRFPEGFTFNVKLIRSVPFEDLPTSVNMYIGRATVLAYQNEYDGDSTKTRDLKQEVFGVPGVSLGLKGEAKAEHIRNVKHNFVASNERLARVTNRINYSRRPG